MASGGRGERTWTAGSRPTGWKGVIPLLLLAVLLPAPPARAMGSMPTGPSESGNQSEVSPLTDMTDMMQARVRLLTDRTFQPVLMDEIEGARQEVVLSLHLFNPTEDPPNRPQAVADLLVRKAAEGVTVVVVLEIGIEASPVTMANRRAARYLQSKGVKVYADMSGTVAHAKLAVIDRKLVFIGSHDISQQSLGRYRDASLVVDSQALATSILGFIESLSPVLYRDPD